VDAFQGKQDDIMLYSMVRANTSELRFIADRRRLNVAFSRAKRLLVIVGHRDTAKLQPDLHKVVDAIPSSAVLKPRRNAMSLDRARTARRRGLRACEESRPSRYRTRSGR
jgi:hypothetical protein